MQDENPKGCENGCVEQDGVCCPKEPPWPAWVAYASTFLFLPVVVMALVVLAQTSVWKLLGWLLILWAFLVPLRLLVCARCPYYGQSCPTLFGKLTARIFPKKQGSMVLGLWLDVAAILALFALPLPDMLRYGGVGALFLWILLFTGAFLAIAKTACARCPLTFCPIGKAGGLAWKLIDTLWEKALEKVRR
jgi:hypothetical protein